MKTLKSILTAAVIIVSLPLLACTASDEPTRNMPEEENEALIFARTLGVGWNLGNNLDAHIDGVSVEIGWGNGKATQKTFDAIKSAGFSSVRIPVTWMGHIGKAPEYHIEKAWLDRVAEVAGYAKNAGLKCIINIHHDGYGAETDPAKKGFHWLDIAAASKDEAVNQQIMQKLTMVWMQIATRFQNEGDWLIFETLNEIQDGKWGQGENLTDDGAQYRVLNQWNQLCVDVIRATGGMNTTRYIGVPGYVCQPGLTIKYFELPYDETPDRLMVAVHMYDPWDYAGSAKYSEWGHSGTDVVPDKAGEREYVATLKDLNRRFIAAGVPVYLGEYGSVHRSTAKAEEFRLYYLEYTCKALREYGMPVFYWDNGHRTSGEESFGIIDHATGKFINNGKEVTETMVNAWNCVDPEYTLLSVWMRAPKK